MKVKVYNRNHKKYRYLASTTGSSTSIPSTYIVFVTKMQKRQTRWNGFALSKKRYHNFWTGFWDYGYI